MGTLNPGGTVEGLTSHDSTMTGGGWVGGGGGMLVGGIGVFGGLTTPDVGDILGANVFLRTRVGCVPVGIKVSIGV